MPSEPRQLPRVRLVSEVYNYQKKGCQLWLLPPYSPDFNPIEQAFSKVKNLLSKAKARTLQALLEATAPKTAEARSARRMPEATSSTAGTVSHPRSTLYGNRSRIERIRKPPAYLPRASKSIRLSLPHSTYLTTTRTSYPLSSTSLAVEIA